MNGDIANLVTNPPHQCHLLSPDPAACDHHGSSYEHQPHASALQQHMGKLNNLIVRQNTQVTVV